MEVKFTDFPNDTNWVSGVVNNGEFNFSAKLFDKNSSYGINGGRVSKLSIWNEEKKEEAGSFFEACIMNYDRGWDIAPDGEYNQKIYNAVMELLENAPKRFTIGGFNIE